MKSINQIVAVMVVVFNIAVSCIHLIYKVNMWEYFMFFTILSTYAGIKLYEREK